MEWREEDRRREHHRPLTTAPVGSRPPTSCTVDCTRGHEHKSDDCGALEDAEDEAEVVAEVEADVDAGRRLMRMRRRSREEESFL